MSDREMVGILYNDKDYKTYLAGLGYKRDNLYISIRYQKRFGGRESDYPMARYTQVDFVLSQTLNFQKLKKGHIIYVE
jgi:hypothetical protein